MSTIKRNGNISTGPDKDKESIDRKASTDKDLHQENKENELEGRNRPDELSDIRKRIQGQAGKIKSSMRRI